MSLSTKQQAKLSGRFTSICREVGILLLAFTPLDYSMHRRDFLMLAGFFLLAVSLLVWSVIRELRGSG